MAFNPDERRRAIDQQVAAMFGRSDGVGVSPHAEALRRAEGWANDAGFSLRWIRFIEANGMLTNPDATKRALWRCAVELYATVQQTTGASDAELLRDLDAQPAATTPAGFPSDRAVIASNRAAPAPARTSCASPGCAQRGARE